MRAKAEHGQACFKYSEMASQQVHISKVPMHKFLRSTIQGLWRAWYQIRIFFTKRDGSIFTGQLRYEAKPSDRPNRQQQGLCTGKSKSCICEGKHEQPKSFKIERVWDILNAGPRHRFTCEGLLVSNCVVLDFGGNIERHGSLDDRNYGRATSSKPGSAKPQEKNGRGRECLNCKLDVPAGEPECPECGFRFPGRHQANADTDSQLTGEVPPEEWRIDVCRWGKHYKRNDREAPPTLRIDYECQPVDGPSGNLTAKHVSEWVCIEHEGFARVKACLWWQQRSISEVPSTVDEALELLNRGACRMPAKVTTVRDGKYQRIKSVEFVDEIPEEWLDEMVPEQSEPILSEYGEEMPF
jgi:hypothetical protein